MRLQHFYIRRSHSSTTHTITSFWLKHAEPSRPITHAMSIILLRTLHTTATRKMKCHHAFCVATMTKPKVVGRGCCCFYNILYEKFIKLGKLRDGNLCALNLYLNSKWPKFSNTNTHILRRE